METWERFFGEAVKEGRLNDNEHNRVAYHRTWTSTGKAFGKTKEPKFRPSPQDDDSTDWLYE